MTDATIIGTIRSGGTAWFYECGLCGYSGTAHYSDGAHANLVLCQDCSTRWHFVNGRLTWRLGLPTSMNELAVTVQHAAEEIARRRHENEQARGRAADVAEGGHQVLLQVRGIRDRAEHGQQNDLQEYRKADAKRKE